MASLGTLGNALGRGWAAFRGALNSDPMAAGGFVRGGYGAGRGYGSHGGADPWESLPARRLRYGLYWGLWENDSYEGGGVGRGIRADKGLYRHTRNLFNPAYRLVRFYGGKIMGGSLDSKAGDDADTSALPIECDEDALRPAIARLWKWSSWSAKKGVYCRLGSMLGDVALVGEDDPDNGRVCMRVVHPGSIAWVGRDPRSREITGYTREEIRHDPRYDPTLYMGDVQAGQQALETVRYTEECRLDGDGSNARLVYSTYLDGEPFAWDGEEATYEVKIPFVPLVLAQHESIERSWGVNCFHSMLSRSLEVDDLASGLSDQIRKAIRAPHLMAGMRKPGSPAAGGDADPTLNIRRRPVTTDEFGRECDTSSDRDEMDFLYTPNALARAQSLVFNLDVAGVKDYILALVEDIEKNCHELLADVDTASGDASGRAVREARKRATGEIQQVRANYDPPLVRMQRMMLAVGGERGYRDFDRSAMNFGLYFDDGIEHEIGRRAVFEIDPADALDEQGQFWANANSAMAAGYPLEMFLADAGRGEDQIDEYMTKKAATEAHAIAVAGHAADVAPGTPAVNGTPQPPKSLSGLQTARAVGPEE